MSCKHAVYAFFFFNMAATILSITRAFVRLWPSVARPSLLYRGLQLKAPRAFITAYPHTRSYCQPADQQDEVQLRYKDKPWEYMESEEYIEKYGGEPVWTGYRRNHKGGIPPQKTRKTCIRGDKICGNPCPICRDPNVIINPQNVKLLQQFISPHTGALYDPTRTGVCMKQQKKLAEAIDTARDHGFLPFSIPFVEFTAEDYSNRHDAVGSTPPAPASTEPWYYWYKDIIPDETEVAKVTKLYKPFQQ
ncbi:small ribosomal subunit protein mS40 [Gouania willdenowi]|uniref:small ribosomal subunit protein mS40 n=1 Tax=Gouania willdenowi TaxID=441366 RepID=UPI0010560F94|nr:28S ribosomal protein S18b, mitochondrial [Gouania willdenowi]